MTATRRVRSTDGTELAVFQSGHPDDGRPTVVAVHGYPDNHSVWDGVAALLGERYRVVTYDVRGSGDSGKPRARSAYRIAQLTDDLAAVLDAVSPDRPVHLLAHDWGSIQSWPALADPRFHGRIASFTSVSGPSLDHAGAWLRTWRHPRHSALQLLDSWYTMVFQLPVLPELVVRGGGAEPVLGLIERAGRSAAGTGATSPRTAADRLNGIQLYRANMVSALLRPRPPRVEIPVLVLAPRSDVPVSVALQTQAPVPYCADLRTRVVAGGHWVVTDRPDVVAEAVREFVEHVEGGPETRSLATARHRRSGPFAGQLVVVTGGGRGIGRATALEFARAGADVLVADINDTAAHETAAAVRALGVDSDAYHLDVSDGPAWEQFAKQVRDDHDVPDVIVNNAGIGMGGPFLRTGVDDWEKVLGVNLWGVIHGCRVFAAQMVERGHGGQIVNIASAAAFAPSKIYPAYATTKAAVLMLSECLRAELGPEGIGVTAVCPGFVDTDISATTIHVGVDEATQAELRDHAVRSYRRRNYTPERLAEHAVAAAARNTPVAAVSLEAKLFRTVSRFAPALGRQIAKLDLNKL